VRSFLWWALYRYDPLHWQGSVFHVRGYVRSNIDGPGRKKEMDEINLMEHYTLTEKQRKHIHSILKQSTKRPLGLPYMEWLLDLVMLFDGTNNKTIIVHGDKKMHEGWIIINVSCAGDSFWSNKNGWVDKEDATLFSGTEKVRFDLPMFGEWLRVTE